MGLEGSYGTFTTQDATVNLNAGVSLPAGTKARGTADADHAFSLVTLVSNTGTVSANFAASFVADDPGPVTCPLNGFATKVTTVTGWNSVTSTVICVTGTSSFAKSMYANNYPAAFEFAAMFEKGADMDQAMSKMTGNTQFNAFTKAMGGKKMPLP